MLNRNLGFSMFLPAAALLLACISTMSASETTFYVVRHADRAGESGSDRLTLVGMQRAQELSYVLRPYTAFVPKDSSLPIAQLTVRWAVNAAASTACDGEVTTIVLTKYRYL